MKINTDKLINSLNKKWHGSRCPYCQNNQWTVDTAIFTPIEVSENKGMKLGGRFQPLIAVSCNNCGNTVLVNGLILDCLDDINENNGDSSKEENNEKQ